MILCSYRLSFLRTSFQNISNVMMTSSLMWRQSTCITVQNQDIEELCFYGNTIIPRFRRMCHYPTKHCRMLQDPFFFFFFFICHPGSQMSLRKGTSLHCGVARSKHQGPVVQSVVSLTSSLRAISLTILEDSIYNFQNFFAEKMWVAFALQKLLTFFQQKISAYLRITRCKF